VIIIGIDEAGRGPLVGSVVAAAVAFPPGFQIDGLTDSKKLSEKKREALYAQIVKECYWASAESNSIEIDEINILQATMMAMKRAASDLQAQLGGQIETQDFKVLVDGNRCPDIENCEAIIKGDLIEPVISAASIIAKVTRDRQMKELDQVYPEYGFSRHKGYGTKEHLEALVKHGPIGGQHRFTFAPIKRLVRA
jgi:ribonuclease HII|tara:strand:+ start:1261 stop:1845 length:585 start_codon:yes stop_codon:yes gene_type:complete